MDNVVAPATLGRRRNPTRPLTFLAGVLALVTGAAAFGTERAMDAMRLLHAGVDYHPDSSHSFFLGGEQSVQCARNSGIYIGAFLTLPWAWLTGRGRASGFPPIRLGMVLALGFGLMVADGINSLVADLGYSAAYPPSTVLRLGTGLLAGTAAGWYFLPVVNGLLWRRSDERPAIRSWRWMVGLLAIESGLLLANVLNVGWLAVPVAALTSVAAVTLFGSVNLLLLVLLLRSDNRYESVRDIASPAAVATCAALVQLGLLGLLVRTVVAT